MELREGFAEQILLLVRFLKMEWMNEKAKPSLHFEIKILINICFANIIGIFH